MRSALDYLKAGLLDRAEEALLKLEGTRFEAQARLALLANYERSRDWEHAAGIARKLEASGQGSFTGRLAHYLCEQAATLMAKADSAGAQSLLQQAIDSAPQVPRPRMDMAALLTESRASRPELPGLDGRTACLACRHSAHCPLAGPERHCIRPSR